LFSDYHGLDVLRQRRERVPARCDVLVCREQHARKRQNQTYRYKRTSLPAYGQHRIDRWSDPLGSPVGLCVYFPALLHLPSRFKTDGNNDAGSLDIVYNFFTLSRNFEMRARRRGLGKLVLRLDRKILARLAS